VQKQTPITPEDAVPAAALNEQRVKEIIASVYMRSPREREISWRDLESDTVLYSLEEGEESLGLDSLDAVEIATELEEAFDLVLPTEIDPAELRTVRQVMEVLARLSDEQRDGP
jgi:acyl carrier protein